MVIATRESLRLPISLTSTLCKVSESFVIDQALKPVVLSSIDLFQFGFIPGSSTTFALISMFHHWLRATDGTGSSVRTALLDFRKAFDLVDHHILVAKLLRIEVKPTAVNWLTDFLSDRKQRVKVNDVFSTWLYRRSRRGPSRDSAWSLAFPRLDIYYNVF